MTGTMGLGFMGTGDRAIGYLQNIFATLKDEGKADVVGVADINPVRAEKRNT